MAKCPNRNSAEYKALKKVYNNNIKTDNVIINYQKLNNTENFPTVSQAKEYIKNEKVMYSLKKSAFAADVKSNLLATKFVHMHKGNMMINKSKRTPNGYGYVTGIKNVSEINIKKVESLLNLWNIPHGPGQVVQIVKTNDSYKIVIADESIKIKDAIPESRGNAEVKVKSIIAHFNLIFPQVKTLLVSEKQAKKYFEDRRKQTGKKDVEFDDINSFYYNKQAILIKERLTEEIAIEEILHPFIDALSIENPSLFNSLTKEAKLAFPKLNLEIENDYSGKKGFDQYERNLEITTQALSRHYKKEYEETPAQSFLKKLKEFMAWFSEIIKDLHRFTSGKNVVFKTTDIKNTTTLSDIAKLLNTTDISFKFDRVLPGIRYSLKPEVQNIVDYVLEQTAGNATQRDTVIKLTNASKTSKKEVDTLSAGKNSDFYDSGNFMIFDEAAHAYFDFINNEEYLSATTAIKGLFKNKEERKLNLAIGNDFDKILNGVLGDVLFDDIAQSLEIVNNEKGRQVYVDLQTRMESLTADGSVAIPQVILFDEKSKIAGTADVIIVTPSGKLKVLDLKTSKNYLKSNSDNYNRNNPLADDSLLKQKTGKQEVSTSFQHNLQVNLYRRMLENMGYEISNAKDATSTFHIKINLEKDANGKEVFNGDYEVEGIYIHPTTQNEKFVDALIPANENVIERNKNKQKQNESDDSNAFNDDEFFTEEEQASENNKTGVTEFDVYLNALEDFQLDLLKRKKSVQQRKGVAELTKSKEATIESINETITSMELAALQGPLAIKAEYTRVIRKAIKDVQEYTDYVLDPNNINNPDYINYVLNFERYSLSFQGLIDLRDLKSSPLSKTQANLVLTLQSKINTLKGDKNNPGIIDNAIFNYVKETVKNVSSATFTEKDLNEILTQVRDIPDYEYFTGDLATSRDTLLAVLDKIYKAKVQEFQDKVKFREEQIAYHASRLSKMDPGTKPEELYKYMAELDKDGLPTGYIIRRLGEQYYDKLRTLRSDMIDSDGNWLSYIPIDDENNATSEDLDFNKALYKKKQAFKEFWSAETSNSSGQIISGNYHEYTEEYKTIREKYASPTVYESGYIKWGKKRGVSDKNWKNFQNKYGEFKETFFAQKTDGEPTGVVTPGKFWVPFKKYTIAKDDAIIDNERVSMLDPKYEKIINPTDALGNARKEFYEFYVSTMGELNAKLTEDAQDQMAGKIPTIKNNIALTLKKEGPVFTKMWAGMKRKTKDFFTETGKFTRAITNEKGEIENSLPIYYTGNLSNEKAIKKVEDKLEALSIKRKNNEISPVEYEKQQGLLIGEQTKLLNAPTASQLSLDLGTSLMKYSAMAENFEVMSSIENTVQSFVKVIEKRDYLNPNPKITTYEKVTGALADGIKKINRKENDLQYNIEKRVKKWLSMVYYDNEETTKNALDKTVNGLIQYSSLAYVATNPLGNINNLVMAKMANTMELVGGNYFDRAAYMRMKYEYNTNGLASLVKRTAYIAKKKGYYDMKKPMSKWEGMVDLFRMMDSSSDIRENLAEEKSWFNKAFDWSYLLNDSFEYNVQSQSGMAILDSHRARDKAGNEVSLYNAFIWDSKNQTVKFNDALYDVIIDRNGKEMKFNDEFKYNIRNRIREVNKIMHGNYAYADRMVMQSHNIGKLAAQFKKWVAPAIKARFRKEYYDENLNWVEGRYRTFVSFMAYATKNISKGGSIMKEYAEIQKELIDKEDSGLGQEEQKVRNKVNNVYKTMGEIGLILTTYLMKDVLAAFFAADDDDAEVIKKLKNLSRYQTDRAYKELIAFVPILGTSEAFQFIKNPLASTRTMGEMAEAVSSTFWTGGNLLIQSKDEFYANKDYVYQRGKRKGQLKMAKEWADILPFIYTIQKWSNFDQARDFYIK